MSKNYLIRPSKNKLNESKNFNDINNETKHNINYYIIHLKRYNERAENLELLKRKLNKQLNIFSGYDKLYLRIEKDKIYYFNELLDINFKVTINNTANSVYNKLNTGEIGCYLSHYKLLEELMRNDNDYSVIFEDDAVILDKIDLDKEVNQILNKIKSDFDLIYLGNLTNNRKNKYIDNIYNINFQDTLWGTHGYLINNKNIPKYYHYLKEMSLPIDIIYQQLIRNNAINGFVISPCLVSQNRHIESTIRNMALIGNNFKGFIKKYNNKLRLRIKI
jgi:glycosyl transferase, family 25